MPKWAEMAIAFFASAAFWGFIQFLINRKDKRKDDLAEIKKHQEEIKKQQAKQEKDSVRTQLLLLISLYPESIHEILKCAEHYFHELKGNWYMTSIFNKYLVKNEIAKPEWFDDND